MTKLYQGDCLIESDRIKDGSIDLILTDPPYGNMDTDGGRKLGISGWDKVLDPAAIYQIANSKLRKNGKLILFSQEPYTAQLINGAIPNLQFSYRAIWEKDNFAVALGANKNMVSYFEDILIFSKKDCDIKNPLKQYTNKIRAYIDRPNAQIYEDFEKAGFNKYAVLDTFNSDNARRYNFPSEKTYNALVHLYSIDKMPEFKSYKEVKNEYVKVTPPSIFNLWEGNKYKSNILKYKKDYDGYHPTQKPVKLLEDLIKTFSNEGDRILDLTMGSGSTGVAAVNCFRNFIGIEKDEKFFEIAKNRIAEAENLNELM